MRANGAKSATLLDCNPYRRALMITEAKQEIPEEAARVALDLMRDGKVPTWALDTMKPEMEAIKLAAT